MKALVPVVAVDGPSGSGKGTLCRLLAEKLGWHLLDSGALYRALGLAALQHSVAFDNSQALEILAKHLDVVFDKGNQQYPVKVMLEGKDVTQDIRSEDCGAAASMVAAIPEVRLALLERQRIFSELPGLVADGRDMGTIVFPNAQIKIFLEASAKERANRRFKQLQGQGLDVNLEGLFSEISERDSRDKHRKVAPLIPAKDAIIVDTTKLSINEVFESILNEITKAKLI